MKDEEIREEDLEEMNRELQEQIGAAQRAEPEEESSGKRNRHGKNKRSRKHRKKKGIQPFRLFVGMLCFVLLLLVAALGGLLFLRYQGGKSLQTTIVEEDVEAPDGVEVDETEKSVIYNGEQYWYNENVVNILCMGVDTSIQDTGDDSIGENGQADALFLAVLDTETGDLSLVNISRDTMIDVDRYNVNAQYLGTEEMQICLAYSYGDGKEESCLNVARSVSRLLYGIPIHAYAAIEYNGISVLNDAIGGVTVEVLEDLTYADPELEAGKTVTLTGQQAHTYVRIRDTEAVDANNARMERQKQYLLAFMQQVLAQSREDISVPLTLYQTASAYMVTDLGASEVTYLASLVLGTGFSAGDMYSISGEVVMGDLYAEFYPDEEALYELILSVFYNKEQS